MQEVQIRVHSNAFRALLEVEALGAFSSSYPAYSVCVADYLNRNIGHLTGVLEDLKRIDPTDELADLADRFRRVFVQLQTRSAEYCRHLGISVRNAFRRMGSILYCLFRRGKRVWTEGAVLFGRETDLVFRAALMDRIADALRMLFTWLRDISRRAEALTDAPAGPIALGAYAARFVLTADTSAGVLIMRFQDNHQELFNLTAAQWKMIRPLLVTRHPLGHARLAGRPQSLLTRHDANGDEIDGDLKRLKSYIHPVGRGRGGTGLYYLAPYPRRMNVVM